MSPFRRPIKGTGRARVRARTRYRGREDAGRRLRVAFIIRSDDDGTMGAVVVLEMRPGSVVIVLAM